MNKQEKLIQIIKKNNSNITKSEKNLVKKAINFNKSIFQEKKRKTKDKYTDHSLNVAIILAEAKLDLSVIIAGILHDVLQQSNKTNLQELKNKFGEEIADLVKGITDLVQIKFKGQIAAEDIQKMFLAMAEDTRVIIIKLAERLDTMERIKHYSPKKEAVLTAKRTLEIYAPLAGLLGIWRIRWQLEDLAFEFLKPKEYKKISEKFGIAKEREREEYIKQVTKILEKEAKKHNIKCSVNGRFKHHYSIYRKIHERNYKFNEICDVFALRVIVDDISKCYKMLGIIHKLWRPKPKRIKDYIASPKSNGYQSLHTTVFGPKKNVTEFQIRTPQMDEEARYGIAAHWLYKNYQKGYIKKSKHWIEGLLNLQRKIPDNKEKKAFVENFRLDLFKDRIFVFTPKGGIIDLPKGATPVDFAYHVHSDIGHKCKRAMVNNRKVDLDTELKNNDLVEIITDPKKEAPNPQWLKSVKSNLAKNKIKERLKKLEKIKNNIILQKNATSQ